MQCENIGKFATTENEMIATAVQPNDSEENRDENVDKWMQVDFKTTSSSSSSSSATAVAAANFSQPERLPERQEEHSTLGGPRLQSQIPLTLTTPTTSTTTTTTSTPSMGRSANFPNRVYEMLEYVTMIQHHHHHQHQRIHKRASSSLPIEATIVAWTIDGAAFDIYQPNDLFVQHLGSKFFPHQSKFRAFVRQLHCWGFQRIPFDPVTATQAHAAATTTTTTTVHRYCHFYFHRYQPQWKRFIQRYNCPKATTNNNSSSNNKQFQQQQQQQLQSRPDRRLFLALPSNNHNVVSSPPINDNIIVIPMRLQRRMSPLSLSSSILLLPHAMGHGHKTQQQYQIQPYLQSQQDRLGSASTHS